jgi:glycosyltransferase involved in cell wall biosynthesis
MLVENLKFSVGITFLSHNDNFTLFYTLTEFFKYTQFGFKTNIYILIQNCSPSYRRSLENLINILKKKDNLFFEKDNVIFEIISIQENLGVSKANNLLYEKSKDCDYVLHIEDDWIFSPCKYPFPCDWLLSCIEILSREKSNISTISLRAYGNENEEYKYGWSRTIPYLCHTYTDNFNYKNKIDFTKPNIICYNNYFNFYSIPNFLFTFNPCIRVNKDYVEKGVYPLIEFEDKDTIEKFNENTKIHDSPSWGFCEALTMEKTRDLNTLLFEKGIFYHQDDNLDILEEKGLSIFSNNFEGIYNVNCHIPILLIHLDDFNTRSIKHDFFCTLHFYLKNIRSEVSNKIHENKIRNFRKILSKYSPKCLITIGEQDFLNNFVNFMKFIPFEYRKKWLHFNNFSDISIDKIENCIYSSYYKHPYRVSNPLVSIITPAYESGKKIFRPLQSLLSQTYTNWEWIIIDDSKSKNTWETLTEMAEEDYRIQIYRRQKNDGSIGKNKLFCGNLATGRYIFELDHDDDILPTTFERLVDAGNKNPDAGFFYSDFIECYEDTMYPFNYGDHFGYGFGSYYRKWFGNYFQYVCKTPRINPHTLRHIIGVPNHFRCWTKESYHLTEGHNHHLQVADDYDLILRTFMKFRWVHIPELLYVQYRNQGGDNFTFHRNALIQHLVNKLRNHYEEDIHKRLEELNVFDDVYHRNAGQTKDWEINFFRYPILENIFNAKDQDSNNPCISIIVPTYNRPQYLKRCLDSIFSQTYQNYEIIVVGDNCPQLDKFILEYPNAKDKRFCYYNLVKQGGPGGHLPRNYALKMIASTKWVAYLDDDNEWKDNHLEHLVEEIRRDKELELIYSSMIIDGKELLFEEPARKGRIDTSTVIHKWDLCVKYGLWKDRNEGGYAHDWEFFNRITNGFKIKYKATKQYTLKYDTTFNGQSFNQLIQM